MLSFVSFNAQPTDREYHSITRHHPDVGDLMDINGLDITAANLTYPGETITSAHDSMR